MIGFLARLLGLSGITDKIKEFIQKVQGAVDRAIDKAIAKVVAVVKKLFGGGKAKDGKPDTRTDAEKAKAVDNGIAEGTKLLEEEGSGSQSAMVKIKAKFKLTELEVRIDSKT